MRTRLVALLACGVALEANAQPAPPNPDALRIRENLCTAAAPLADSVPQRWNGWGAGVRNTRFQTAEAGGITAADVPRLRLKWAYGLPQEQQPRGQPAVIGGRLFVGSQAGAVYALDAKTGCTIWQFFPRAGSRSALSVGPHRFANGRNGYAVYFVDAQGSRVRRRRRQRRANLDDARRGSPDGARHGRRHAARRHGVRADDGHQRSDGRRESRVRVLHVPRQHDGARRRDGRGALEDAHDPGVAAARHEQRR